MNENLPMVHAFEAKGLGVAPFEVVDTDVVDEGHGRCAFCGRAIKLYAVIQSTDGNKFMVGWDCAQRTGDKGMILATSAKRKKQVMARAAYFEDEGRIAFERKAFWDEARAMDEELRSTYGSKVPPFPAWPDPTLPFAELPNETESDQTANAREADLRESKAAFRLTMKWLALTPARLYSLPADQGRRLLRLHNRMDAWELDLIRKQREEEGKRRR